MPAACVLYLYTTYIVPSITHVVIIETKRGSEIKLSILEVYAMSM